MRWGDGEVVALCRVLKGHVTAIWPGPLPGAIELKLVRGGKPLLGLPWGVRRTPVQCTARVGSARASTGAGTEPRCRQIERCSCR